MILLGVDPGLASTGWGVLRRVGLRYECVDFGCVRTKADAELGWRLQTIHEAIAALIREHHPHTMVMEHLYALRGGNTGLSVGQAIGVTRLAASQAGVPVTEYTPTHVKMTLVGNGQAEKHQVQFMVQRLLNLSAPPKPDHAADALALCICHLHSGLSRAAHAPGSAAAPLDRVTAALAADDARRAAHLAREAQTR